MKGRVDFGGLSAVEDGVLHGVPMLIVFHSLDGRFSDNPRALYDAIRQSGHGDELVWTAHPAHKDSFPAEIKTVDVGGGRDCLDVLEQADLVVANHHLDMDWRKKPGATYLQTWHGTPLKRIHWDVLWAPEGRLDRLSRDVDRWDWLLSPNAASTPRLRNAFRFDRTVLETGYPRNDVLSSADASRIRAHVRNLLDIPESTIAVLYAPTWRDDVVFDDAIGQIADPLKMQDALAALGDEFCMLRRLHYMLADRWRSFDHPQVRDVSRHPEISDLFLAADVLITDYSSAMFDFAITGKPILFHAHDLADFRDRVRGFYFDLTADPPGPMLESADEVAAALRDLPGVRARHKDAYARFAVRYCGLEDGQATRRVLSYVDALR